MGSARRGNRDFSNLHKSPNRRLVIMNDKKSPLVVGCVRDRNARTAIRDSGCEFLAVPAHKHLLSTDFPDRPRLFVLQVTADEIEKTHEVVRALRREWPLTDVLIWAPQATGRGVRACFQGGAKDVILDNSIAQLVDRLRETLRRQRILPRVNDLSRLRSKGSRFANMFSRSALMWDLFELCTRVAPSDATVLIVGETGTGKELLARAVHMHSGRQGRFVAANCGNIPRELINSELFGHEKGAFTGAERSRKGLVTHAHQGTLFLDEIGDMPAETQQSLLRMLQEKRIRPVGSVSELQVDVRIVAATNVSLDQAVREGDFREDLFYRLDVIRMNVAPLRERPEDILFLFGHFTKRLAKHYALDPPTFSDSFLDALLEYTWPGNVRQLENFSERLVLARPQRALTASDFEKLRNTSLADTRPAKQHNSSASRTRVDLSRTLEENLNPALEQLEQEYLHAVLKQNAGQIAESAEQAGISRRTLLRKMNRYHLDKSDYKR
jgi:DNA-binding NtrC family response regulator